MLCQDALHIDQSQCFLDTLSRLCSHCSVCLWEGCCHLITPKLLDSAVHMARCPLVQGSAVTCIVYLPVKQGFVLEIQALGGPSYCASTGGETRGEEPQDRSVLGGRRKERQMKTHFTFMFLLFQRNCSVSKEDWFWFEKNWHSAQINVLF